MNVLDAPDGEADTSHRFDEALLRLARLDIHALGGLDGLLAGLTREVSRTLGVARASVWTFSEDRRRLTCRCVCLAGEDRIVDGAEILASDHPAYFGALAEARVIAACDARRDPRTSEFAEAMAGFGIVSMLDAPVRLRGEVAGALSTEHVGARRAWTRDEEAFVASAAEIVATALEAEHHRQAESALRESDARFRAFLDQTHDAVFCYEYDPPVPTDLPPAEQFERLRDGVLVECNPVCAQDYGYQLPSDAIGKRLRDLVRIRPESETGVRPEETPFGRMIQSGYHLEGMESTRVRRDGSLRHLVTSVHGTVVDGALVRVWGCFRDETARRQEQEALRRYEQIVSNVPDLLSFLDKSYTYRAVNETYLHAHAKSRDEIVGHSVPDLMGAEVFEHTVRPRLDRCLAGERVSYQAWFDYEGIGKRYTDVTYIPYVGESGEVTGVVVSVRDITDRRRLEEQLLHSQKMEAVGRLAGGVAHDFNNLLTAIMSRVELAREQLGHDECSRLGIDDIAAASERAADLTRQLLAFARRQVIEPRVLDVSERIAETERLLRRLVGEHIALEADLPSDSWRVKIDPGQLEQIVLNLAVNARDAMPEGGSLRIATEQLTVGTLDVPPGGEMAPGDYVHLMVSDTGHGMDDDVLVHAFEPFFTTKGPGEGTGLGLATCHGIVRQNGGHVWIDSEPGRGTVVHVCLPRADEVAAPRRAPPVSRLAPGAETVLVVEDEEMVREVAIAALQSCGYRVLSAGTGPEALALAEAHDGEIALLLTDVVLPGMNGAEVARRLRDARPGTRVLFASGYPDSSFADDGVVGQDVNFLQKPYRVTTLSQKVREVLDGERP